MKKILILILLVFFVMLAGLSAQSQISFPVTSLQSGVSFGLFPNVMDASFNLISFGDMDNFRTLNNNYLFVGLSNFWDLTTTSVSSAKPAQAGFYHKGPMPWSVLGAAYATTTNSGFNNGISSSTTATKVTGTAPDLTNNVWVTQTINDQYVWLDAASYDVGSQFLIQMGGISTGLVIQYYYKQDYSGAGAATWAANNRTETETNYYDTAIATAAPNPAVDYTVTRTWSSPDTYTEIIGAVPLFLEFDSVQLSTVTSVDFVMYDGTTFSTYSGGVGPTTEIYSDPVGPGPAGGIYTNTEANSDVVKYKSVIIGSGSTVVLPALFKGNKNNRLEVSLGGNVGFFMHDPEVDTYITQTYNYPGGGADPTASTRSVQTKTTNYAGMTYYKVMAKVRHYLYFDFGPAVFGVSPIIDASVENNPYLGYTPFYKTSSTEVVRVDGDNDGAFTSAADTITTTTTTYNNYDDGIPFELRVTVMAPASLKFHQEKWPFGVTLGADVGVTYTIDFTTDVTDRTSTVHHQEDGTGTVLDNTTTTAATGYTVTDVTQSWIFTNWFKLGLNFFLPNDITIDVILNSSNLLQFDALTAQVNIPL